eukprot:SAG31_NODE_2791_length_5085_cov_2.671480_5_plen_70_part_00
MPTLLTGQETMVTPTEEAAQEFEKQKSESTITVSIPQWATDGYQKALEYVNDTVDHHEQNAAVKFQIIF